MKPKVVYIVSDLNFALAFKWLIEHLDRNIVDLHFILIQHTTTSSEMESLLQAHDIPCQILVVRNSRLATLYSVFRLAAILNRMRPSAIHCHMRRANIIGLFAGKLARIKRRIYTRHYSTQNHKYYPHAVQTDKLLQKLATHIVAPSLTVRNALVDLENVPAKKVHTIPHGFDLEYFAHPDPNKTEILKLKLELTHSGPVIGVISRHLELKGLQYIIPAFTTFLQQNPNAVLVMSNAHGPYAQKVDELLTQIPKKSWRKLEFEKNLAELYNCFDYFVHAPIDPDIEAFGQIYIEALAAGVPSVFTLSGIANEFIVHEKNALVVPFAQAEPIAVALLRLNEDQSLREKIRIRGYESVKPYGLKTFIDHTTALYV